MDVLHYIEAKAIAEDDYVLDMEEEQEAEATAGLNEEEVLPEQAAGTSDDKAKASQRSDQAMLIPIRVWRFWACRMLHGLLSSSFVRMKPPWSTGALEACCSSDARGGILASQQFSSNQSSKSLC